MVLYNVRRHVGVIVVLQLAGTLVEGDELCKMAASKSMVGSDGCKNIVLFILRMLPKYVVGATKFT